MLLKNWKILNNGNNDNDPFAGVLYNLITFQDGLTLISLLSLIAHPHLSDRAITLKVERYLLGKLKFNCNSMSYQATEGSAVKQRARAIRQPSLKFE